MNLSCVWISLIVHQARPSFMFQAAGDVQWNASCSQPYHVQAKLSLAHTRLAMAKCNTQSFTQPYSRTELSMVYIRLMMAKCKCTTCAQPKLSSEHFARVKMVPKLLLTHSWNTNTCIVYVMNCPLIPGHGQRICKRIDILISESTVDKMLTTKAIILDKKMTTKVINTTQEINT